MEPRHHAGPNYCQRAFQLASPTIPNEEDQNGRPGDGAFHYTVLYSPTGGPFVGGCSKACPDDGNASRASLPILWQSIPEAVEPKESISPLYSILDEARLARLHVSEAEADSVDSSASATQRTGESNNCDEESVLRGLQSTEFYHVIDIDGKTTASSPAVILKTAHSPQNNIGINLYADRPAKQQSPETIIASNEHRRTNSNPHLLPDYGAVPNDLPQQLLETATTGTCIATDSGDVKYSGRLQPVVVVLQPNVSIEPPPSAQPRPRQGMHFFWHIIFAFLVFVGCGLIFGGVALLLALKAESAIRALDKPRSRRYARASLAVSIAGVVLGATALLVGLVVSSAHPTNHG